MMLKNIFDKPIPPLAPRRKDLPLALEAVIMQLLERDVSKRMPSARVALQSLRAIEVGAGARSLGAAAELTIRTTASSAAQLPSVGVKPRASQEAVTLPGR
jgi:hypothetical protein